MCDFVNHISYSHKNKHAARAGLFVQGRGTGLYVHYSLNHPAAQNDISIIKSTEIFKNPDIRSKFLERYLFLGDQIFKHKALPNVSSYGGTKRNPTKWESLSQAEQAFATTGIGIQKTIENSFARTFFNTYSYCRIWQLPNSHKKKPLANECENQETCTIIDVPTYDRMTKFTKTACISRNMKILFDGCSDLDVVQLSSKRVV